MPRFTAASIPTLIWRWSILLRSSSHRSETVPEEESFFEAHRLYLDIHLMLSGTERVEIAVPGTLAPLRSEPENDFYAYTGVGRSLVLSPNEFLVVFPNDAHRIKMRVDGPETVSKAVFKVKIV